ncbi:MAG: hypothetical protein HGGPFJEG_01892 [Ignavibacteria bacterium]|nr:hypothetical protein [Ignavibacteria bacterium]
MNFLKLNCLITGDRFEDVKNETPESKKKIRMYSMLIFLPVMLWMLQGYLLVNSVMSFDFIYAAITSLISGIVVFCIDRSIIMSNGGPFLKYSRVVLGIIIAIIGAFVLDEVIFKSDIQRQLEENNRIFIAQEVKKWEEQNSSLIEKKRIFVDDLKNSTEKLRQVFIDEMNGTYGTKVKGAGKIATEKYLLYQDEKRKYEINKSELDQMISEYVKNKETFKNELVKVSLDGLLLNRIKAMFDLIFNSMPMLICWILFTLIFIAIELMIVIVKLSGKKTSYEKSNELKEFICNERINRIMQRIPDQIIDSDYNPKVVKVNKYLSESNVNLF